MELRDCRCKRLLLQRTGIRDKGRSFGGALNKEKNMKKIVMILALLLIPSLVFAAASSFEGIEIKQNDGTVVFEIDSSGRITEGANETAVKSVSIPLTDFRLPNGNAIPQTDEEFYVSGGTAMLGTIDENPAILLGQAVTDESPIGTDVHEVVASFRIPENYYQNGVFYAIVGSQENAHAATLDFAVRRGTTSTRDTTWTNETAVALSASATTHTVAQETLNPASEDDSFAADNWVTIKLFRGYNLTGFENNLAIYNVIFEYESQY